MSEQPRLTAAGRVWLGVAVLAAAGGVVVGAGREAVVPPTATAPSPTGPVLSVDEYQDVLTEIDESLRTVHERVLVVGDDGFGVVQEESVKLLEQEAVRLRDLRPPADVEREHAALHVAVDSAVRALNAPTPVRSPACLVDPSPAQWTRQLVDTDAQILGSNVFPPAAIRTTRRWRSTCTPGPPRRSAGSPATTTCT